MGERNGDRGCVDVSAITEIDRYHMHLGLAAAQAHLIDLFWQKAKGGNASVMIWLMRRIEKTERSHDREAVQRSRP
jgi:hypothetical protein